MNSLHLASRAGKSTRRHSSAFTLVEVLVILATIAVLACLTIPTMAGTKWPVKRVQCANNLRQFTLAMVTYGMENDSRLPVATSGNWAWDAPVYMTDALDRYGAHRAQMYCPGFPDQNYDPYWNFSPSYRVTGYAMTLANVNTPPGNGPVLLRNQNPSLLPRQTTIGAIGIPAPLAAQRVLIADVVLNSTGNSSDYTTMINYNWIDINGGGAVHHRTSHLNGRIPAGGNLGMLDGHVEWHDIRGMSARNGGNAPYFYW